MIPQNLAQAINHSDLNMAKSIIIRQLNNDRNQIKMLTLEWATEASRLLKNKGVELYQEDDMKTIFLTDKNQWDKNYWETLRSDFKFNYSEKKLQHIMQVMQYLREQGHPDFQIIQERSEYSSTSTLPQSKDYYIRGGVGAIIGGVGGKLLGFGIGGLVIGMVVGLGTAYLKNNRK